MVVLGSRETRQVISGDLLPDGSAWWFDWGFLFKYFEGFEVCEIYWALTNAYY